MLLYSNVVKWRRESVGFVLVLFLFSTLQAIKDIDVLQEFNKIKVKK